jgi:hypothetical protein
MNRVSSAAALLAVLALAVTGCGATTERGHHAPEAAREPAPVDAIHQGTIDLSLAPGGAR